MATSPVLAGSTDWLGSSELHPYLVLDVFADRCLE